MRQIFAIALPFIILALSEAAFADVFLIKNGVAQTAIYVSADVMAPDKPQHQRLRESVQDLALTLQKMSGAKVEIRTQSPRNSKAQDANKALPILIGDVAVQALGAPAQKSPYKQGWRLVVSRKGVGLIGESDEATSYAIYELLDRLGCRWYMPGAMGEVIPSFKNISLPEMDISAVPATITRNIWYRDEAFARRNRLGGFQLQTGHALEISGYISKEQLQAYPDWNAQINGKRSINGRYCWGNSAVSAAVAEGIITKLDKEYSPSISLSPDDGVNFCECEKCKALDAGDWDASMNQVSITDRYVHFCNRVVERVEKKHPNVVFGFLAYVQYTRPPVREKLHPELVPQIAPITYCRAHTMTDHTCPSRQALRPIVEGWGKVAPSVAYYNYMFNLAEVSVPYPMMRQMSVELPLLYANNVKFWTPETTPNFESVLPGMYLSIRKSWHTKANPTAILDEFFARFYGAAAIPMRRYWQIFDDAWIQVPEHAGSGFGHARRFTPEVMKTARNAIDEALVACATPMEYRRVKMQDASLRQFERFMKLRWDLQEGRLADLDRDALRWKGAQLALGDEYESDYAFNKVRWAPLTISGEYFKMFFEPSYIEGARIARDFTVVSPSLRRWRYQVDKNNKGKALGWNQVEFDDKDWKSTDSSVDTWSSLGLHNFYGTVWYRNLVKVGAVPSGKKVYLWLSSTDGKSEVFVNGHHIPYVNNKGEKLDAFTGFSKPASFDITTALKPDVDNQISIAGTRPELSEVGTGGLMGPVFLYHEK